MKLMRDLNLRVKTASLMAKGAGAAAVLGSVKEREV